ncbi:MAG: PD40 domain-containing protein [Candidatus Saccharimonas sp.]|nr:PD40 domain-containing protein [Planctomycetaceae bacterium]
MTPKRRFTLVAGGLVIGGVTLVCVAAYLLSYLPLPVAQDRFGSYSAGGQFYTAAPDPSPDGASLVFASPSTGRGDIYLMDVSTRKFERITSTDTTEFSPIFAPDGKSIAFGRYENGRAAVYLMDLANHSETQLSPPNTGDEPIAFSPDGTHLLLHRLSWLGGKGLLLEHIVVEIATKTEHKTDGDIAFAPDGKTAFLARRTTANSEGSEIVRVPMGDWDSPTPVSMGWSVELTATENKMLVTGSHNFPGTLIDLDSGKGTNLGPYVCFFASSGDGRALWTSIPQTSLWTLDLTQPGAKPTSITFPWPGNRVTAIRGVKDGFLVEVVAFNQKVATVYRLTLFGQPPERLFSASDDLLKP